jgi:hypothetical protein
MTPVVRLHDLFAIERPWDEYADAPWLSEARAPENWRWRPGSGSSLHVRPLSVKNGRQVAAQIVQDCIPGW